MRANKTAVLRISFVLSFLFLSFFGYATTIPIQNVEFDLTPHLSYYIEPNQKLTIDEAHDLVQKNTFIKSDKKRALNFGTNSKSVWVYLELTSEEDLQKILHFSCTYIYYLDLYEKNGGNEWTSYTPTGKKRDFENRGELKPKDFAWKVTFKKGETKKMLLRAETKSIMLLPLSLKSINTYITQTTNIHLLYGLYFGVLIIMMLYNFIIYFTLKEKAYLYYIISIFCTIMIFSSSNGFLTKYLFPNSWYASYFLSETFMCLMLAPTALFAVNFLDLKKYTKFGYYLMLFMASISVPAVFISRYFEYSSLASALVALLAVSLITVGFIALIKKNPFALYYVIAWFVYLTGGLLVTLRNLGYLPSTIITDNGAEIGSVIEVCLLAFALANKYRKIRHEKNELQKERIELIENKKIELEQLVQERTTKLFETIEELNTTLAHLSEQKIELEFKNKNITSSINYALKIQEAILPHPDELQKSFKDYFQLYLPKDIVSGDFIFYLEDEGVKYYAIADCTGHGVPGAIMSILGYSILYEIIKIHQFKSTSEILEQLDAKLKVRISQNANGVNDGMDLSLITIDPQKNILSYSGAVNPVLIINTDQSFELIKGTKRSIGDKDRCHGEFVQHIFELDKIAWVYLFSDGYQDQFGEKEGTKFYSKNLRELLITNTQLSGVEQLKILYTEFANWKGKLEQVDDVTVAGIRLN